MLYWCPYHLEGNGVCTGVLTLKAQGKGVYKTAGIMLFHLNRVSVKMQPYSAGAVSGVFAVTGRQRTSTAEICACLNGLNSK